jgi:hypothetical protein
MTSEARFEPQVVIAALNEADVRFVIVGGLAVAAHGVVRATHDLDLVPDPDLSNVATLAACLTELGGTHPIEGALTGDNLARPAAITIRTRHGDVQVLNRMPAIPPWRQLYAERVTVKLPDGPRAPICSLAHLRAMKRAAGRARDQVDLAELDAVHRDEPG